MQLNIFQTVAPLLKEKKFNIDVETFINFMAQYKHEDWVYPDAIHRERGIDIKLIYEILGICVSEGLLEQYLNIYCPRCQKFTGEIYKTIFDIPEFVNCVHCDTEIENPIRHAIIIYRVL